ncbi:3-hydroxyacyl-CoA dehydrogenase family protein [Chloroflexota bacterium]
MAAVTRRPARFLGMHWFNPPQVMKGVEIVRTEKTSQETVDAVIAVCKRAGKQPAICIDSPSFIANRLLQVYRNEALKLYDEGVASFQDIDTAFKEVYDFRMGPFELSDLIGMDIAMVGCATTYRELGRSIFQPARCQIMKYRAGDLGRKTGMGFYKYER